MVLTLDLVDSESSEACFLLFFYEILVDSTLAIRAKIFMSTVC